MEGRQRRKGRGMGASRGVLWGTCLGLRQLCIFCDQKDLALMPLTQRSTQCMETSVLWCKKFAHCRVESVDEKQPDHAVSNQKPASFLSVLRKA